MQVKDFINIYINSKYGQGKPYDFYFTFEQQLMNLDWNRMSLVKFALPKSYYIITTQNQLVILNIDNVEYQINLPLGNYSAIQMQNQLQLSLNNVLNNDPNNFVNYFYVFLNNPNFLYDVSQTGKYYIFHVQQNTSQTIKLKFPNNYEIFGFENSDYYQFTQNTIYKTNVWDQLLISQQMVRVFPENNIYILCDAVKEDINVGNNSGSGILEVAYTQAQISFGYFVFQNINPLLTSKKVRKQNKMRFQIVDENFQQLTTLTGDISFHIIFFSRDNSQEETNILLKNQYLQTVMK